MTERARALAGIAALALALLAGCSDDDSGPLSDDQLGDVSETTTHSSGAPTATLCPDLTDAQQSISVSGAAENPDNYRYWTYRLDDGTWVAVSVLDPGPEYDDPSRALDEIAAAAESCSTRQSEDPVTPLDDVPDGSVGFRASRTDSNGTQIGDTLYSTAGDRIVMVVATQEKGTEPSVDVRDLLSDVQDRAADLDLS